MQESKVLNVTDIQVDAAKLANQIFFWRLELDSGKTVDQFDPITGKSQQFPNWVTWVEKSPLDPYSGNPAFKGIREAFWIPVIPGANAFHVDGSNCHSIVLFRKNYVRETGGTYTVYCIGKRWDDDNPKEEVYHICPPARYHKTDGSIVMFNGDVSLVIEPLGKNGFDRFIDKHKNV